MRDGCVKGLEGLLGLLKWEHDVQKEHKRIGSPGITNSNAHNKKNPNPFNNWLQVFCVNQKYLELQRFILLYINRFQCLKFQGIAYLCYGAPFNPFAAGPSCIFCAAAEGDSFPLLCRCSIGRNQGICVGVSEA